jgi:hypothetical protein
MKNGYIMIYFSINYNINLFEIVSFKSIIYKYYIAILKELSSILKVLTKYSIS